MASDLSKVYIISLKPENIDLRKIESTLIDQQFLTHDGFVKWSSKYLF